MPLLSIGWGFFFCFLHTITYRLTRQKHSHIFSSLFFFFKGNVTFFFTGEARLQIPEFILHLTQSPFLNVELFTACWQYAPFPLPSVTPDVVKLHFSTVN